MKWQFQVREAINNLWLNKLRAFLAILGVLVGTCAVVTLVSIGEMAKYKALLEFKSLGMDLASLNVSQNIDYSKGIDLSHTLTPDYNYAQTMFTLPQKIPAILAVAPLASLSAQSTFKGQKLDAAIIATTPSYAKLTHLEMENGRFLYTLDRSNYFCVIGSALAEKMKLQGALHIVGQEIQIGDAYFTVIGVAKPWDGNTLVQADINNSIITSLDAVHRVVSSLYIDSVLLQLTPNADPDQIQSAIRAFLNQQFPGLDIDIRTGKELIQSMTHQKNIFTWMLGMIGSIALLVSGIGIMNVMLVSVTERRREIGIRLAIGAKQKDIQNMFLLEATVLSCLGGIIGIIISLIISNIVADFLSWTFIFSGLAIVIGFFVSIATGIFFGFYPAYKASQLNPIDVLRAE